MLELEIIIYWKDITIFITYLTIFIIVFEISIFLANYIVYCYIKMQLVTKNGSWKN